MKNKALAQFLEIDLSEIEQKDDDTFEVGREEYLVLTDDEADQKTKEHILETVWAFNASFLASQSGIDDDVIRTIQENGKCEDNNAVLLKLIDDVDHFVNDAIRADGRGHFLSRYDGEENEIRIGDETLYIYRAN